MTSIPFFSLVGCKKKEHEFFLSIQGEFKNIVKDMELMYELILVQEIFLVNDRVFILYISPELFEKSLYKIKVTLKSEELNDLKAYNEEVYRILYFCHSICKSGSNLSKKPVRATEIVF